MRTLRRATLAAMAWAVLTVPAQAQEKAPEVPAASVPNAAAIIIQGKKMRRNYSEFRMDTRSGSSCAFGNAYNPYDQTAVADYLGSFGHRGDRYQTASPMGNARGFRPGEGFRGCNSADVRFAAGRHHIASRDKTLGEALNAFDSEDYPRALELFEKAFTKVGYDDAGLMAGKMYLYGLGTPQDVDKGIVWLKKVADAKLPRYRVQGFKPEAPYAMSSRTDATMTLAKIYLTGWQVPQDLETARNYYAKADEIEYLPATHILGHMYRDGFAGDPPNVKKALAQYKKAGDGGFTPSQYQLGMMYMTGEGISPDTKSATKWLMAAAGGGHPDALYEVGRMYDLGETLPRNPDKALLYYKDAALKDQPAAQTALGTYFYTGEILQKDLVMARKWFEVAANNGNADAMFNLSVMLMSGEGGNKDMALAYVWMKLADLSGLEKAAAPAAQMGAKLSPEDRARAEAILNPPAA